MMFYKLLGRLVWFTGKVAVKYVVVPIAVTAATAVVLEKLADRLDERNGVHVDPDGEPYQDLSHA